MLANTKEENSGLAFYLHTFDKKAPSTEPYTRITLHLMKDVFLAKVRFGEKLGYDHNIDIFEGSVGGGLLITIQGEKDPIHMEICVEKILGELNVSLQVQQLKFSILCMKSATRSSRIGSACTLPSRQSTTGSRLKRRRTGTRSPGATGQSTSVSQLYRN
ncbi:metalloprotease [Entomophthora muscae]|uniref:Metalloprotease n=1 Tax=Entomophthora muscae TaxID=34485 RepID=A0ACC2RRH7_9FUNG|nr:metalloprotease [Entomophthora muscae]